MKSAFKKNVCRQIKNSFNRFIAIFGIVALGVGFFAGLKATTPVMKMSADQYYDKTNLMDFRVLSTLGLTQEDVDAIRDVEGVQDVFASRSVDTLVDFADGQRAVKVMAYDSDARINKLDVMQGRLPQNENECVVDYRIAKGNPAISVGSVIQIAENKDMFSSDVYTIVGIVTTSYYYSIDRESTTIGNGTLSGFISLHSSQFTSDYYTEIYALVAGASDLFSYGDAYKELVDDVCTRVEQISDQRIEVRYQQIYHEAKTQIDKAQTELDEKRQEAVQELAAAEKKISDGQAELDRGYAELSIAHSQLIAGEKGLNEKQEQAKIQFGQKEQELADSMHQYEATEKDYHNLLSNAKQTQSAADELLVQINSLIAAGQDQQAQVLQPQYEQLVLTAETLYQNAAQMKVGLDAAKAQLDNGYTQLEAAKISAQAEMDKYTEQLQRACMEYENGKQTLAHAEIELTDSQHKYEEQKKDVYAKLDESQAQIDENREQLRQIDKPEWYILDRSSNIGYAGFEENAAKIDAIATVFPIFFFLVAALVCLTTMTRMVEEQRTQIGVLKSLGYSKRSIILKYLFYADTASILGSIFGLCIGYIVFPTVIMHTYDILYNTIDITLDFNIEYAFISSLAAVICISAATLWACYKELSEVPAQLIRPKAPKKGKKVFLERIGFLWKRLSFTWKVTARNLIRYKKRFFMTVIGIGGCTALLLTGFGLSDSINGIVPKQFDELQFTDITMTLQQASTSNADSELNKVLDSKFSDIIYLKQSNIDASNGDSQMSVYLVVPEQAEQFHKFMNFRHRVNHEDVSFPNSDGVIITEKLASKLKLSIGSSFTIKTGDEPGIEIVVGDICENYAYNYIYMSAEQYTKYYGTDPSYKTVWGKYGTEMHETDEQVLCTQLLETENVENASRVSQTRNSVKDMLNGLNAVVVLIVICASSLAFIVLYNLTNINITERIREIATIKVLGFRDYEVSAYVYRENFILTFIGMAVGLVLGIFLHGYVIITAEVDMVMFVRTISPLSYVLAGILTVAFSLIVNLVAYFSLKKVDMIESLKSVE